MNPIERAMAWVVIEILGLFGLGDLFYKGLMQALAENLLLVAQQKEPPEAPEPVGAGVRR